MSNQREYQGRLNWLILPALRNAIRVDLLFLFTVIERPVLAAPSCTSVIAIASRMRPLEYCDQFNYSDHPKGVTVEFTGAAYRAHVSPQSNSYLYHAIKEADSILKCNYCNRV